MEIKKSYKYTCVDEIERTFKSFRWGTSKEIGQDIGRLVSNLFHRDKDYSDKDFLKSLMIVFSEMFSELYCSHPLKPAEIENSIDAVDIPELIDIALGMSGINIDAIFETLLQKHQISVESDNNN